MPQHADRPGKRPTPRRFLRNNDAAAFLSERGVPTSGWTLRKWRTHGTGPAAVFDPQSHSWLYPMDALESFVEQRFAQFQSGVRISQREWLQSPDVRKRTRAALAARRSAAP